MDSASIHQQLGRFVVMFQSLEDAVQEIIILIAGKKEYVAKAFLTRTEFHSKVEIADVIFTHFAEITANTDASAKDEFHKLMNACKDVGEDRNNIVHSVYSSLTKVDGSIVLLQENRKLRFKGGSRILNNERALSADDLKKYCDDVNELLGKIEAYRLKLIAWM